ncbi:MAG: hypothetical protein R3D01_14075 [Hyphomicrobiales bacterium]
MAKTLHDLIAKAPGMAVTTIASNVARGFVLWPVPRAAGRELIVGRAMYRVIEAAQATGYLDPDLHFRETAFAKLPPRKVAYVPAAKAKREPPWLGSPQASIPTSHSDPGDWVISYRRAPFRAMKGPVGRVQNAFARRQSRSLPTRTLSSMFQAIRAAAGRRAVSLGEAARGGADARRGGATSRPMPGRRGKGLGVNEVVRATQWHDGSASAGTC